MLWLYQLGGQIETQESSRYVAIMVLVFASICNTAQYIVSGPLFVGMSGVVYGLLGYIWMMTLPGGNTIYSVGANGEMFMLLWLGLCLVGIIPHVANTEHVVGILLGVAWGCAVRGGARCADVVAGVSSFRELAGRMTLLARGRRVARR